MRALAGLIVAATLASAVGWAEVVNGDFEAEGGAAWRRVGRGVSVRRVDPPGWRRYASEFDSRNHRQIRLYLRIQTGAGVVWFDDVAVGGLEVRNAGFEVADGDDIAEWEQDNVGETIFSSGDEAVDGTRSACLEHERHGVSRIWQDLECEPNTTYDASVWMRTSRFRGDAYAEIYGMKAGELDGIIWQSPHLSGETDERLARKVLELVDAGEGTGGVEQEVELEPDSNLLLSADLAVPLLVDGAITVGVWSGGELLAETRVEMETSGWETRQAILQSPPGGKATVRVDAGGRNVLAYLDNVVIGRPGEGMSAMRAQFVGADRNLVLDGSLFVTLPDPRRDLLRKGAAILGRELAAATNGEVTVTEGEGHPLLDVTVERPESGGPLGWPTTESYVLSCSESGVHIVAPTDRGAFYGLMALTALLDQTPGGEWQLIAAKLEDAPQLPFRGTYMGGLPRDRAERIVWCERFAALRLNAVVFEDEIWWSLDNEERRRAAQEAFADFRSYGLEPIPELQSFGWAHIVLALDPMVAEGTWVERERLVLKGEQPVPLAHANVLRTESTDIIIENAQGIAYEEGRDYQVLGGETTHVYRPDAEPYRIQRLPNGRIPDGGIVCASYDYVSRVNAQNCPYCPSEPRVAEMMVHAIQNTVRHLSPKYVHIGHDEPAQMNTDSRCRARHMTNAELFAEDVNRLNDAAREIDPDVRLMMWADAVNPYHNGLQFARDPTADALGSLPADLVLNVWFYGPDQPRQQGANSLRFFGAQGFTTTGSPWDDPVCAERWAQVCLASRLRGEDCMGALYTSWGGRWGALEEFARNAWRPLAQAAQVVQATDR